MKQHVILAIGLSMLMLSSCSTITRTAQTADVSADIYALAVADMTVAPKKVSIVKEYKWSPFSHVSLSAQKTSATAELLKANGADVLVEPQYIVTQRGFMRGGKVEVSGYPATYKNFRAMTKEDAEKIAILNNECAGQTVTRPIVHKAGQKNKKSVKTGFRGFLGKFLQK